jgi:hypothetical protein
MRVVTPRCIAWLVSTRRVRAIDDEEDDDAMHRRAFVHSSFTVITERETTDCVVFRA